MRGFRSLQGVSSRLGRGFSGLQKHLQALGGGFRVSSSLGFPYRIPTTKLVKPQIKLQGGQKVKLSLYLKD